MSRVRLSVALVALLVLFFAGRFVWRARMVSPSTDATSVSFTVEPGMRGAEVALHLQEEGVISSAFGFRVYTRLTGKSAAIPTGVFDFKEGMSYKEALQVLITAKAQEVQVTIPEGYTLKQIGVAVREKIPTITEEAWNAAVGVDSPFASDPFVVASEKPESVDLEGYLFPDTYRFFANATAEDVVKKLLRAMEEHVATVSFVPNEQLPTTHALLTLSSILEREVRHPSEMGNVSDIFLKRLKIGMPLQADSTVNYVTGGTDPSVSHADTQLDSPYNTYKYPDLPPGPISSPGMNALQAAAHPSENIWYYFATDEAGEVYYAKTYDEHLQNVARHVR